MSEIILHHYPQSPVAEKVRVVLGMKKLSWRSVEIPRLPPKPDLIPLTGGYRRTPVLQIGADIYCDSQCIIRELERRFPQPNLCPGNTEGLCWALSRWAGELLFFDIVTVALGTPKELDQTFAADRLRLYFGAEATREDLIRNVPTALAQIRTQFGWLDNTLSAEGNFLFGDLPSLADASIYFLVWFLRGRYSESNEFLQQFVNLVDWEDRIKDLGHGEYSPMSPEDALDIAKGAKSEVVPGRLRDNDFGLSLDSTVRIAPAEDSGDPFVEGTLVSLDANTISIRREEERVGQVVVHFPRVGSKIQLIDSIQ